MLNMRKSSRPNRCSSIQPSTARLFSRSMTPSRYSVGLHFTRGRPSAYASSLKTRTIVWRTPSRSNAVSMRDGHAPLGRRRLIAPTRLRPTGPFREGTEVPNRPRTTTSKKADLPYPFGACSKVMPDLPNSKTLPTPNDRIQSQFALINRKSRGLVRTGSASTASPSSLRISSAPRFATSASIASGVPGAIGTVPGAITKATSFSSIPTVFRRNVRTVSALLQRDGCRIVALSAAGVRSDIRITSTTKSRSGVARK